MQTQKRYDAVIVLGMNIRPTADGFRPASYNDHDEFGMLGGQMNVIAAALLHDQRVSDVFVFTTGTSQKTKTALGPNVPTEAKVYSQDFLRRIKDSRQPISTIILEENSVNTYSNLTECTQIITKHGWKRVAIMSARYHVPRVTALWDMIRQQHPTNIKVDILAAEDIVTTLSPGMYDDQIEQAYRSEWGIKRMQSEQQGVADLNSGRYVLTEFQLAKKA